MDHLFLFCWKCNRTSPITILVFCMSTTYSFKKGNHYPQFTFPKIHFGKNKQEFTVKFSKECLYQPSNWENDYNKLIGWSYGLHHKNSIRVCWRPTYVNGSWSRIQLCIYVYENSTRIISRETIIIDVELDYKFSLIYDKGAKRVFLYGEAGTSDVIIQPYSTEPCWGYILKPYHGGNGPAPQDYTITLTT